MQFSVLLVLSSECRAPLSLSSRTSDSECRDLLSLLNSQL